MIKPKIVIMAGGTGGHVFPALAVARALQSKGWEIHWIGTETGLEAEIVPKAGFKLHYIVIKGLRRKGILHKLMAPYQIIAAIYQSLRILLTLKPMVVLGMGGYVAGPAGVAAWLLRYPLIIHEQNSVVGFTNRCLALLATRVLEAFPNAFKPSQQAIYTGNPVRAELLSIAPPNERFADRSSPLRLLIIGGSRGALALNQICPQAIEQLPLEKRPEIWHQTGGGHDKATLELYQKANVVARVQPFIDDMAKAYAWADLVLCRAGALTIAELSAVGIGSVLVPFPYATDDHQTTNGQFLEKLGAAKLIPQSILKPQTLALTLLELLNDKNQLLAMANAAYQAACRNALIDVTAVCEETSCYAPKKS